jgi:thioredoxin-like negative regulator of GroEL
MDPIVDGLEDKYAGAFKIVRVNVGDREGTQLARAYGCIGQPAFVLFDSSGEQVRRLIGAQTVETFEQEIEQILEQKE